MKETFFNKLSIEKIFVYFFILVAFFYLINSLSGILTPFFLGFIGAYILNYPTRSLEKIKIPRAIASLIVIGLFFSIIFIVFFIALPYVQKELVSLAKSFPNVVMNWFNAIKKHLNDLGLADLNQSLSYDQFSNNIGDFMGFGIQFIMNLLSNGGRLASLLSMTVVTPIIMFYWLKDWDKFTAFVFSKIGNDFKALAKEMNQVVGKYIKGQSLVCISLIVLYPAVLFLIGFKNYMLVGFIAGLFSFVPYLGVVTAVLLGLSININNSLTDPTQSVSFLTLMVAIGFVAFIEAYILSPKLIGSRIKVHPICILFSLMAAGTWFGFIGIVMAMPIAAIIRLILSKLYV